MSYRKAVYFLHITLPVLIAVISIFIISDKVSGSEYLAGVTSAIDESREDAAALAASATAVSVAITALPGDLATPVASTLADLSKGFLVVLCALYLEKLIFPIIGVVVFQWLVPLSCAVYIVGFLSRSKGVSRLAYRLACFALLLFLLVPVEAKISGLIREKYGETMEQTLASAKNSAKLIEESIEENNADENAGNGLAKILKNLQQTGDQIARGTSQFMKYLEKLVSRFMEAIAVMLVTSCFIPILVVLVFIWITKMIFMTGMDSNVKIVNIDRFKEKPKKEGKHEKTDQ